jgi:hypothetical protein
MAKKPDAKLFRREDIPGINPALPDMADPFQVAKILGVSMTRLRARQVPLLTPPASKLNQLVNDFYII